MEFVGARNRGFIPHRPREVRMIPKPSHRQGSKLKELKWLRQ